MTIINSTFAKDKLCIAGVSGGPDSMFLLDNLRQKKYKIIVAHVNYKKRISSDFDEELVKKYCQKFSLSLEIYSVEESEYNYISNFQGKAREIRYYFFQKLADKYQTKHIFVAHHHDDHLETYLLQKQRKSLVECWGLQFCTKFGKYWIIRPLLSLTKKKIIQYLDQKKIDYVTDTTNQLLIYQRNIIRKKMFNFSSKNKKTLSQEISQNNRELEKIKSLVKTEQERLITPSWKMIISKNEKFSQEVYLRLLYFWINQATNGLLRKKKKQLLFEIYKQLFISQKKKLIINLGSNFQIVKFNDRSTIILKK